MSSYDVTRYDCPVCDYTEPRLSSEKDGFFFCVKCRADRKESIKMVQRKEMR